MWSLGGTGLLALLCVPAVGLSRAARQQQATVISPGLRALLWLGLGWGRGLGAAAGWGWVWRRAHLAPTG
jgi:cytochrome c oxidase assembly protein subunit 15